MVRARVLVLFLLVEEVAARAPIHVQLTPCSFRWYLHGTDKIDSWQGSGAQVAIRPANMQTSGG